MTPAQNSLYWNLWNAAKDAQGWLSHPKAVQDQLRYDAHHIAITSHGEMGAQSAAPLAIPDPAKPLTGPISCKTLTDPELDRVFAYFKYLGHSATLRDGLQLAATDRDDPGESRRLRWVIEHELLPQLNELYCEGERYLWKICHNKFMKDHLDDLNTIQLTQLRSTLVRAINHRRAKVRAAHAPV